MSQTRSSRPGEPTVRAISALTMKMPEPIMAPMTIIMASNRDISRLKCGAPGSGARRRRGDGHGRAPELALADAVGEVDDQADGHPGEESDPCLIGQVGHQIDAGQDAQDGYEGHEWGPERPGKVGSRVAQDKDAAADDGKSEQRANAHQLRDDSHREQGRCDADGKTGGDRGDMGGAELRVDPGRSRRQQSVLGHREEDTGLAHKLDQHDRHQADDGCDLDQGRQPEETHGVDGHGHGRRDVEVGVAHDAGEDEREGDVDRRAGEEGPQDADGHVPLGILGFLRGRRDGVEAEVGEEHDPGPAEDAAPAEEAGHPGVRRDERMPECRLDEEQPGPDEDEDDADLEKDDDRIDGSRLLDAPDEDESDKGDDQKRPAN